MVQPYEVKYNGTIVLDTLYFEEELEIGLSKVIKKTPLSSFQTLVVRRSCQKYHNSLWLIASRGMGQRPQQPLAPQR